MFAWHCCERPPLGRDSNGLPRCVLCHISASKSLPIKGQVALFAEDSLTFDDRLQASMFHSETLESLDTPRWTGKPLCVPGRDATFVGWIQTDNRSLRVSKVAPQNGPAIQTMSTTLLEEEEPTPSLPFDHHYSLLGSFHNALSLPSSEWSYLATTAQTIQ